MSSLRDDRYIARMVVTEEAWADPLWQGEIKGALRAEVTRALPEGYEGPSKFTVRRGVDDLLHIRYTVILEDVA